MLIYLLKVQEFFFFFHYLSIHSRKFVVAEKYPELVKFYSDKLFFVLEIQIIDLCTVLISGTEEDFKTQLRNYLDSDDFKTLKSVCKLDKSLCSKIKIMLYTLYCYSRFNNRIIRFTDELFGALNYEEV